MINKATGRYSLILKTISLTVVFCFTIQQVAFAGNGTPIWSLIKGNQVLNARAKDFVKLSGISIPEDYGIVRETFNAGNNRIIIHIQDAHANLSAQESISKLIGCLVEDYSLKLVMLEGAHGFVDVSPLSSHPDDKIRKDLARYFLNRGKINAAEYYKTVSKSSVKLYGAEDPRLYKDNASAYIRSLNNKGEIHKAVITLKKTVSDLKRKIYSKRLIELDRKRKDYQVERISFKEYWQYIGKIARSLRLDISKYESLFMLLEASQLEERIDFKKAENQRKELIDILSEKLPKEDIEQLLSESLSFRLNKIPPSTFHKHLFDFAKKADVDSTPYPDLENYAEYINMYDAVLEDKLFEEMDALVQEIEGGLFRNEDQEQLALISRRADILVDLLDAKILNRDLAYYKAHRDDFIPQAIAHQLTKLMVKHSITTNLVPDMRIVARTLPVIETFYEIAAKRNKEMVEN